MKICGKRFNVTTFIVVMGIFLWNDLHEQRERGTVRWWRFPVSVVMATIWARLMTYEPRDDKP